MTSKSIILAGGAGYIGSHIAALMLARDIDIIIIDNFANSSPVVFDRLERITGRRPKLIEADLASAQGAATVLDELRPHDIWGAVHLAGLKAVGESVEQPSRYYDVNINTTLNLIKILDQLNATKLVFSSSASVYGAENNSPVSEEGVLAAANPYGSTKILNERLLADHVRARSKWQVINLRYFNPVGAHPSGLIGEDPTGIPNNLFPYIAQVAVGRRPHVSVFGGDYDTPDGTGIRDYIHVDDLALGHLAAVDYLTNQNRGDVMPINLGSGHGHSVLEVISAFSRAAGKHIPIELVDRRPGDVAMSFANPSRAEKLLGWAATRSLDEMCRDHWRWQSGNRDGYRAAESNSE